jgi:4-hydroxy-4-methyl-2-oxoglutarate aldolase
MMADRDQSSVRLAGGGGGPGSCDVSDACDALGIDVTRTGALLPMWPGCAAVSGSLATVRLERATGAASPLPELIDLLASARGAIVFVDLGGRVDVQCWGTVLASAARSFGVRGALVNGAARDVEGLQQLGLPTYARGVYPGAMSGRLRVAAVGEPVEIDSDLALPSSLAVIDASGAVFVPEARAQEVIAHATERQAREQDLLDAIAKGADPREVLRDSPGKQKRSNEAE